MMGSVDDTRVFPPMLRDLVKLARDQDWTIEKTSGGHIRWRHPDDRVETVITSATCPNKGVLKNMVADLRRHGLVTDKGEWKRRKKRLAGIENLRADVFTPEYIRNNALFEVVDDDGNPVDRLHMGDSVLSDADLFYVGRYMAEWSYDHGATTPMEPDQMRSTCVNCGTDFKQDDASLWWLALVKHESDCITFTKGADVDISEYMNNFKEPPQPPAPTRDVIDVSDYEPPPPDFDPEDAAMDRLTAPTPADPFDAARQAAAPSRAASRPPDHVRPDDDLIAMTDLVIGEKYVLVDNDLLTAIDDFHQAAMRLRWYARRGIDTN